MFNKILEINHLLKKLPISDEEDFAALDLCCPGVIYF